MAESKGSMASGLTASINQTFNFGKIIVMAVTFIVSTAWVLFLTWVAGKIPTKDWSRFLQYSIQMVGVMGAVYLMLSAMVAVAKMTAVNTGGKKIGFVGGFGVMGASVLKVIIATIVPVAILALTVGVLWGMGLLGVIPKFGPVFWGIFSFIPVIISLFAAFVLAKLFLVVFLIPGIIATTNQSGYKSYKAASDIIKTRLVKLLAWFIVVVILISVFFTIVNFSIATMSGHTRKTIGERNFGVIGAGSMPRVLITNAIRLGGQSLTPALGVPPSGAAGGEMITGGWFFGIELGIVLAILCSCGYIFFAVGGMYAYKTLSAEPEDPIAFKIPMDFGGISQRAAKFTEAVSEKVKAEMSEDEAEKKTPKKQG